MRWNLTVYPTPVAQHPDGASRRPIPKVADSENDGIAQQVTVRPAGQTPFGAATNRIQTCSYPPIRSGRQVGLDHVR
jgi:hypothetical protein